MTPVRVAHVGRLLLFLNDIDFFGITVGAVICPLWINGLDGFTTLIAAAGGGGGGGGGGAPQGTWSACPWAKLPYRSRESKSSPDDAHLDELESKPSMAYSSCLVRTGDDELIKHRYYLLAVANTRLSAADPARDWQFPCASIFIPKHHNRRCDAKTGVRSYHNSHHHGKGESAQHLAAHEEKNQDG